ncbi:hypothetical protein [Mycobacterium tilburgii]|uniref:hypothetical protein n=1 Tax=Mycobacterium tilburgii TaxID=44467 RepID=UPI0021B188DC|nr:hypothetical protein [Mycobacterium tilburgii]
MPAAAMPSLDIYAGSFDDDLEAVATTLNDAPSRIVEILAVPPDHLKLRPGSNISRAARTKTALCHDN